MPKTIVLYDGSNFYNGAKRLYPDGHLSRFNYIGLADRLVKDRPEQVNYKVTTGSWWG